MKKTVKKITALILTVLLIIPLVSVQGFALFDKITDVKITEKEVLSARYIDDYIGILEEVEATEEDYYFYEVGVKADITISTGEVISCSEWGMGTSQDKKRTCYVEVYIDIRDYEKAVKEGKNTIPLYYSAVLLSSIDIELDKISGETEITFVDCIIKELIPVSGIPESYEEKGLIDSIINDEQGETEEELLLKDAVFDIVYADGSVKRETVKIAEGEYYSYEVLDGEEIYYWINEEAGILEIYYIDALVEAPIEFIPYPIADVKIDSVKVSDAFEPESVTYTVTKSDGTTFVCTTDISAEKGSDVMGFKGYIEEVMEGVPVVIFVEEYSGDEYPPRDYISVTVFADLAAMDSMEIEGPEQEGTALGELIYKIISFIKKLINRFMLIV